MAQPTFRRYWVKVADGNFFPQFDDAGYEHSWQSIDVKPEAVLFVPFTRELAAKVRAKGAQAEVADLPPIEILVAESVEWCRPSFIRVIPHMVCGFCGAELPEGVEAICPRCFASHHWYCDICDEFKDPVFRQQVAYCPDCDERGLMRVDQLGETWEEKHTHYTRLVVDGQTRLIFDFRVNR